MEAGLAGEHEVPIQIVPDLSRYHRQTLLQTSDGLKEVDFKGHFHPNELVRKIGREIVQMGYRLEVEHLDITKTPVGSRTGQFLGVIHGTTSVTVDPAGRYSYLATGRFAGALLVGLVTLLFIFVNLWVGLVGLGLSVALIIFRHQLFGRVFTYAGELKTELIVGIPGEMYEDFRREEQVPISTNASAMISRRVSGFWVYNQPKEREIRERAKGKDEPDPEWDLNFRSRIAKSKIDMEKLVRKVEAERGAIL